MAQLLPLQKYEAKDFNGLVTEAHLYSLYQKRPELISNVIKSIYETNLQGSLTQFVNKFPVKEVSEENGFYNWMLKGQEDKNLPLIDAETISGASVSAGTFPGTIGANREQFYLIFDEPLFEPTNVLKGEVEDYHYLVHEMEEAGGRYKYRVELVNDNTSTSVPAVELEVGRRFSKFYGLTPGTLSYRGSKPWFTSPFRMENRPSMMRMQYEVPGSMIQQGKNAPLEFPFSAKGRTEKVWINYQDMVADFQCEEMFARMLLYGKKNWTNDHQYLNKDENTKYEIASGSGFFEQIAPSNVHYYNSYDIEYHMSVLLDMGIGKIPRGKRHIHIQTGEYGAIEIHRQIEANSSGKWTVIASDLVYKKTKDTNLGTSNTLGYGYQFNEYTYWNGIRLTVEIVDFFDDDVYFPQRHPDGKGIVESHRMLAMGYGGDAGVYRVKIKGVEDAWGYIPGLRDPFSPGGAGKSKIMASPLDGYEVHKAKWGGMMIEDPTKIVDMKLNVIR